MDNKTKLKRTVCLVGNTTEIGTLALVATALAPIIGAARSIKLLLNKKAKNGKITEHDLEIASNSYGRDILTPGKMFIDDMRGIKKRFLTEEPITNIEKSDISDIIKLIQNAPNITRTPKGDIIVGDLKIDPYGACYSSNGSIMFTFPKTYDSADRIIDVATQKLIISRIINAVNKPYTR